MRDEINPKFCEKCKKLVDAKSFKYGNTRYYLLNCGHWEMFVLYQRDES